MNNQLDMPLNFITHVLIEALPTFDCLSDKRRGIYHQLAEPYACAPEHNWAYILSNYHQMAVTNACAPLRHINVMPRAFIKQMFNKVLPLC